MSITDLCSKVTEYTTGRRKHLMVTTHRPNKQLNTTQNIIIMIVKILLSDFQVHSRHEPPDLPNNWEDEIVALLKDNPKCD